MTIKEILDNEEIKFDFDSDKKLFEEIDKLFEEDELLQELEAEDRVDLSRRYKEQRKKHSTNYGKEANLGYKEGNEKFKKGREALVTRILNLLDKKGISSTRSIVRSYLFKKYKQWKRESPAYSDKNGKAYFIKPIERGSRKLSFDPQNYREGNPKDTSVYQKEYKGRGYFFKSFCDQVVKDFERKEKAKSSNKGKFSKKNKNKR